MRSGVRATLDRAAAGGGGGRSAGEGRKRPQRGAGLRVVRAAGARPGRAAQRRETLESPPARAWMRSRCGRKRRRRHRYGRGGLERTPRRARRQRSGRAEGSGRGRGEERGAAGAPTSVPRGRAREALAAQTTHRLTPLCHPPSRRSPRRRGATVSSRAAPTRSSRAPTWASNLQRTDRHQRRRMAATEAAKTTTIRNQKREKIGGSAAPPRRPIRRLTPSERGSGASRRDPTTRHGPAGPQGPLRQRARAKRSRVKIDRENPPRPWPRRARPGAARRRRAPRRPRPPAQSSLASRGRRSLRPTAAAFRRQPRFPTAMEKKGGRGEGGSGRDAEERLRIAATASREESLHMPMRCAVPDDGRAGDGFALTRPTSLRTRPGIGRGP